MQRREFIAATVAATALGVTAPCKSVAAKRTSKGFVVKAGQNRFKETTKLPGNSPVDIKVSTKDTAGMLSISEYTGYTKGGPPLHIHPEQDEVFMVLAGEHLFQLGDEQYRLTAGDTIFIPRNTPHAPAQLSDTGKYLFFFTPSGKMEDFFRALSGLKGKSSPQEFAKIFADHDMKVVGPPLKIE